jgi:hypothetical protein
MSRPIIFHLADGAMEQGFRAFFRRNNWHYALQCDRFEIDPASDTDILRIGGKTDPAVWQGAHEHLAPFKALYDHAVIVIDEHFDPSPGATQIKQDVRNNMVNAGWAPERFEVVVIQPMLESWLWMDSDHIAKAFGVSDYTTLRNQLISEGLWDADTPKPKGSELKAACKRACQLGGTKSSRATFSHIFSAVSSRALNRCEEPGFNLMRTTLRIWFPPQGGAA